jgi:hypothetical protein
MKDIKCFSLILIIIATLISFIGCFGSPLIDIIIENQTGQTLTVYHGDISGKLLGEITSGSQISVQWGMDNGPYQITAKDSIGKVVFSGNYTHNKNDEYHLIETNIKHEGVVKVYKAVIPPLTKSPINSDNATPK